MFHPSWEPLRTAPLPLSLSETKEELECKVVDLSRVVVAIELRPKISGSAVTSDPHSSVLIPEVHDCIQNHNREEKSRKDNLQGSQMEAKGPKTNAPLLVLVFSTVSPYDTYFTFEERRHDFAQKLQGSPNLVVSTKAWTRLTCKLAHICQKCRMPWWHTWKTLNYNSRPPTPE